MARIWPRVVELVLVLVAGFLVTPALPSLPTPPPLLGLPLPTPSVPSLQPTPVPTAVATPQPSAPAVQPTAVPQSGSNANAPAASAPPADNGAPRRVPIPFTSVYVSSPLDLALIGALMTLPLLVAIWLFLFLRTVDQARQARDAQTRLALAADLGLHPRDLTSMSTKSLFALREKAAFDELTGVLRRAAGIGIAEKEIARALRHKTPLTVAFIDVDELKETNQREGRAAGDALLRGLVQALRQGLRGEDVVFRYAGDEFVCVLPDTNAKEGRATLGGIQLEAARSGIRFAMGVAELERTDDVVSLFARADDDLYEFKTKRGEIVPFPPPGVKSRSEEPAGDQFGI